MPALLVFVVFLIAIAVSIPIGVSMILGSIAPIFLMGKGGSVVQLLNNTFSGANSTPILAVPLFILGGVIMAKGGISKKLFNFFSYFAGRMPGGLPCAVILTCLFYGAISGSGPATTAAVGSMCVPFLTDLGYEKKWSAGLIAVAGGLGVIIPPSIPFVLYSLATGVSTLAKLLNPKIKVIGVEPANANCMQESIKNGKVTTLPSVNTIADGTAVKTPGTKIFPYIQKNLDDIITVEDAELVGAFLDMVENHKLIVENSGLLTVAALKHLDLKGKKVVSILSGGNMDVITMSSVVQQGLILRDRIFTVSVLLPDKPGELSKVAAVVAKEHGNVIKLSHNQFVSINRSAAVELRITMESFGTEHKQEIISALEKEGYRPKVVQTNM